MDHRQFDRLATAITHISRYIQHIKDRYMKPYGLRSAHVACLLCLERGAMTAAALTAESGLDKAAVSRCMADLEHAGYVVCDAPVGKRKYRAMLHLTEHGQQMVTRIEQYIHHTMNNACQGLSQEERITMEHALQQLAENLQPLAAEQQGEIDMTEKVKLMTDSACDIPLEAEQQYNIDILPFAITVGNNSYLSRRDFTFEQFYDMLEASSSIPTTSQITPFAFSEIFEQAWEDGYTDLIYVSINSAGSATYSNAELAAQQFYDAHPEAKDSFHLRLIDSGSYTMCYGYGVIEAARRLQAGCKASEAEAFLRQWCQQVAALFSIYDLKYAAKSGRIPSLAAFVGNALGIKPIMQLHDHAICTVGKVRGERQVIPTLLKRALEEIQPDSPCLVIYGNHTQLRDAMTDALRQHGREPDGYCQIGPEIALNAGPHLTGLIYLKQPAE